VAETEKEDHGLRPAWATSLQDLISTNSWIWWPKPVIQLHWKMRPHLNRKSWASWHMSVIPATAGSINRKIIVQADQGKK
jgi:hypothetical protein